MILLIGETGEDLGGTEYLRCVHSREQGTPPVLNLERERAVQRLLLAAVDRGLVRSAHDCSEGGLAVAVAESCLSSEPACGARIVLKQKRLRRDSLLFGESQSRIVVSVKSTDLRAFEKLGREAAVPMEQIGAVGGAHLVMAICDERGTTTTWIDRPCQALAEGWRSALANLMASTPSAEGRDA